MRLVLLCQRLGRIQKDAREGITMVVAGALPEAAIPELTDRCGEGFAAAVAQLTPPDENGRPTMAPIAWRLGAKGEQWAS